MSLASFGVALADRVVGSVPANVSVAGVMGRELGEDVGSRGRGITLPVMLGTGSTTKWP